MKNFETSKLLNANSSASTSRTVSLHGLSKQSGLGLLELILVLVIGMLFLVLGLRMYEKQKQSQDFSQTGKNAQLLIHAANNYYYTYCATNILDKKTDSDGKPIPEVFSKDGYFDPKKVGMLNKAITIESLQKEDIYKNQFLSDDFHIHFPFGKFKDGQAFHISLKEAPFTKNTCPSKNANSPKAGNCFGQTHLWQTTVSACVTAFTKVIKHRGKPNKYKPPKPTDIQRMFSANSTAINASTCEHGVIINWYSIPRVHQAALTSEGDVLQSAQQQEINQMYRYGPWMQQGDLSTKLKPRVDYLCQ